LNLDKRKNIAVVGGGVTGLTIADALAENGYRITVYEKDAAGGLAYGFPCSDDRAVYVDKYYHHIFTSDSACLELLDKHELSSDILWAKSKAALFSGGRIYQFATPVDLLKCRIISSPFQRIRMGLNLLKIKEMKDWSSLDSVSCRDYFADRSNLDGYKALWEPLLKQKYGEHYAKIPASFLWGRLNARMHSRKGGREILGYLKGGFQRLILAMLESIRRRGGAIHTASPVTGIKAGEQPEVKTDRTTAYFDRVIWTGSMDALSGVLENPTTRYSQLAQTISSIAVTCMVLFLERALGKYYWLNNIDPDVTFGAAIEHTNLVPVSHYAGRHILYVANYHPAGSPLQKMTPEEIFEFHRPSLQKVFPAFRGREVIRKMVFSDNHASPLYDLGFSKRIPPHQGLLENIDICNMAQVYPQDRNMNNCMENANNYVRSFYKI